MRRSDARSRGENTLPNNKAENSQWIELHNTTGADINVKGWCVDFYRPEDIAGVPLTSATVTRAMLKVVLTPSRRVVSLTVSVRVDPAAKTYWSVEGKGQSGNSGVVTGDPAAGTVRASFQRLISSP